MESLFEELKQGLEEGIAYAKGTGDAVARTYSIIPPGKYTAAEIRELRMKCGMTQKVFAAYLGVTVKAVEAWENGRTHPSGPARRLMDILVRGDAFRYVIEKNK